MSGDAEKHCGFSDNPDGTDRAVFGDMDAGIASKAPDSLYTHMSLSEPLLGRRIEERRRRETREWAVGGARVGCGVRRAMSGNVCVSLGSVFMKIGRWVCMLPRRMAMWLRLTLCFIVFRPLRQRGIQRTVRVRRL